MVGDALKLCSRLLRARFKPLQEEHPKVKNVLMKLQDLLSIEHKMFCTLCLNEQLDKPKNLTQDMAIWKPNAKTLKIDYIKLR